LIDNLAVKVMCSERARVHAELPREGPRE
jgi:hypothetical protein